VLLTRYFDHIFAWSTSYHCLQLGRICSLTIAEYSPKPLIISIFK
jgi:hypothetical protein